MTRTFDWSGVMPAITTPFTDDLKIDHDFVAKHVRWLADHGSTGIVPCGSIGEGATLSIEEKFDLVETCVTAVDGRVPVMPGIAAASTSDARKLARGCAERGAGALMVLPAYIHSGSWRETRAHFDAVLEATRLPAMLYNNPVAYGTDVLPEQIAALAEQHQNLQAVKESSGDIRRMAAIRALTGDRLALFVGLDDLIVEGIAAGAVGWIAGLVNALPVESIRLFDLATSGDTERTRTLYEWFLPLLRLDTVPEFVQLIKMVQAEVGMGSVVVRPPRLEIEDKQARELRTLIQQSLARNPMASL